MTSLWSSISQTKTSNSSGIPMISNVDATVQENYTKMNYQGQNTNTELQNIYKQIEPTLGIPLTYDAAGNLTFPNNFNTLNNGLSSMGSNIISLLKSDNPTGDTIDTNILSQYNAIEDGTYQYNLSSILSSNLNGMYNNISSLQNNQTKSIGEYLDTTA
jgi:hypothetical protein